MAGVTVCHLSLVPDRCCVQCPVSRAPNKTARPPRRQSFLSQHMMPLAPADLVMVGGGEDRAGGSVGKVLWRK